VVRGRYAVESKRREGAGLQGRGRGGCGIRGRGEGGERDAGVPSDSARGMLGGEGRGGRKGVHAYPRWSTGGDRGWFKKELPKTYPQLLRTWRKRVAVRFKGQRRGMSSVCTHSIDMARRARFRKKPKQFDHPWGTGPNH